MACGDSTEGFSIRGNTILHELFHSTWIDLKNGQYTTMGAMMIIFLISLLIAIIRMIHQWWHQIGKHEVLLNLYLTYSGDNLCSTCKRKAGRDSGFIEDHLYTLNVKLVDFVRVQIFNPFAAGYKLSHPQCIQNTEAEACLHVHDCGGLESIEYEMLTEQPSHLLCLQSLQYNSVLVEENARGCFNQRKYKQLTNRPEFVKKLGRFFHFFMHDMFPERYFCSGSIVTIEEVNLHKKVIASPPRS